MKILKNNYSPPVKIIKRATCYWCNSVIEYYDTEVDRLGFVKCPACEKSFCEDNKAAHLEIIFDDTDESSISDEVPVTTPTTVCENCEKEFEYREEDITVGAYRIAKITCPFCDEETEVLDYKTEPITADNLMFSDFYSFYGGVNIPFEEVKGWIKRGIKHLRENKDESWFYTGTGDSHVVILKLSEDEAYEVIYSKGYFDIDIPFEECDYD